MATALIVLAAPRPAAATNCLWGGGTGNFRDKNWANCGVPGKEDNVIIGAYWLNPPTGYVTIDRQQEFHDLTLSAGSKIDLSFIALIHGNSFTNNGTLNLVQRSNVRPYFRSYSKNLIISGNGIIVLDNGDLGGNMTFGAGQIVLGAGTIGADSDRLFNDGEITANFAGKEILLQNAINGTGSFRSQNNASLHFTGDSSGDTLINDSLVQLEGANFTVAKDYQGAYFYTGNDFDARRTVIGTGQIFAADARQTVSGARLAGNVIDFGAMRVGDQVDTSLVVANTGGLTVLRGAVQNRNAPNVTVTDPDFVLVPGSAHTSGLTFSATTSGFISGQTIDVVNNFDNVSDDHLAVSARVYAPAVAYVASTTVDFGTVRKSAAGAAAGVTIGNLAGGSLSDVLLASFGATPGGITFTAPLVYLPGTTGRATYQLDTAAAGFVGGSTSVAFTSHDAELADLSLGSKTLVFTGTVTDPAVAELAKASGAGVFGGGGSVYTLDLGRLDRGSGILSTDITVLNAVFGSDFAETLGGDFTLTGDAGYSFFGDAFSGLAGGGSGIGNWLRFDPRGLAEGRYQGVLTFDGFSHYAGLDDLALGSIRLNISAQVVPEPATWALMIAGFGVSGLGLRCRRALASVDLTGASER